MIRLQPGFDCAFEFVVRSGSGLGLDIKTVCGFSWLVSLDFPAVMDDGCGNSFFYFGWVGNSGNDGLFY